jgi:hypothetical protein
MPQRTTLATAALLCLGLGAGLVAHGAPARAQDVSGAPSRMAVQHVRFTCMLTSVEKSGDLVTRVGLGLHPDETNTDAWNSWLATSLALPVKLSVSSMWHAEEGDAGHLADNANGTATIDLDVPGTPGFSTDPGTRVYLFYDVQE